MTAFTQMKEADASLVEFEPQAPPPPKRPSRWSLTNWPVRWKVLAIVLVPLLLAATFGVLRVYSSASGAADLRIAAERADVVPTIVNYTDALEGAMVTVTEGGDAQAVTSQFDARRSELQQQLNNVDVVSDVRLAATTLLDRGQDLINKVMANSIDLRTRVTTYAPLLLTAETAITGSVRNDEASVQGMADGLSRAVGARGQMAMQQMLVNSGGSLTEPELRTSMITLAGTEPSTVAAMSKVLGGASQEAGTLRSQMVRRMSLLSDPSVVLVGNPDLLASQQATAQVADKLISDTTTAIPAAVDREAADQKSAAIRDAALVAAAFVIALIIVLLVARSLVRPLRLLRDSALRVAHDDLNREIDEVRNGGDPGPIQPIPVHTSEEIGQVAHAVDELHEQAVLLAGEQARLQLQVSDMFETLSRRSRSLVDQQLSLIDKLERNEEDPDRLESLFRLDHLAARMRRNGANLLVLAGAKVPREQAEPVPVSAVINAAASEVEDYTRVVTATLPDTDIVGPVAGDLVHLLAELLDNALRYSPPISQARVSAVHTGNGGLVIEVSDIGLGMTEADLRVANTRLSSGGEVNPYTARHMGLFVVGRLATAHGLVVRLRSTVDGKQNSGTTAGVYVPAELILRSPEHTDDPSYGTPADAHAGIVTALALDEDHDRDSDSDAGYAENMHLNGHADLPVSLLPQRAPGASGISGVPEPSERVAVTDTSSFFASRTQDTPDEPQPSTNGVHRTPAHGPASDVAAEDQSVSGRADDAIYQTMLSEYLIDPTDLGRSTDLDWQSVWDNGWSVAAAAEDDPVAQHTEEGLPLRNPGARLVPGGVDAATRNGGAHRSISHDDEVASAAAFDTEYTTGLDAAGFFPQRDPEAVRASFSSHFGGVHAARSHARETRGTDNE